MNSLKPSSISKIIRKLESARTNKKGSKVSVDFPAIKDNIVSYLIGSEDTAYILSIVPQKHYCIHPNIIFQSLVYNAGTCYEKEKPRSKLNIREYLNDLIIHGYKYTVNYWDQEQSSIIFCSYSPDTTLFTTSIRKYSVGLSPEEDVLSVMRYKTSFALYNFQDNIVTFISPVEAQGEPRKDSIYQRTIHDLSQCHQHSQWLWDFDTMTRYNMTKCDSNTYTVSSSAKRNEIMELVLQICATSEDGSTCVSYFSKQDTSKPYQHSLIVWNGRNAQITRTIALEPKQSAPKHPILSKNGRQLTYEISSKNATQICSLTMRSVPMQNNYYELDHPLEWSMTTEDGIILAACGKNQIHLINPQLNIHTVIAVNQPWKSLPRFALNPTAQSLVWSYKASPTQVPQSTFKFVALEKLDLRNYNLKTIEFTYLLLRAIRIAHEDQQKLPAQEKSKKVIVDLNKKIAAYYDFMALPREISDFFLSTYGAPHGPLRVAGESSCHRPADAWEKLLY